MTAKPRTTPIVPGVYFLFKEGDLIYVGQSKDCYARIDAHRGNGRPFDLATVMPLEPQFLGQVEKALIRSYKPPGNVTHAQKSGPGRAADTQAAPNFARMQFKRVFPEPPKFAPGPDALGTISRGKARDLASAYGVTQYAIAEGEEEGALRFVSAGRRSGRGEIYVARFDEVEAYLRKRQERRLEELGLSHVGRQDSKTGDTWLHIMGVDGDSLIMKPEAANVALIRCSRHGENR